jgi:hypothetical protein
LPSIAGEYERAVQEYSAAITLCPSLFKGKRGAEKRGEKVREGERREERKLERGREERRRERRRREEQRWEGRGGEVDVAWRA